MLENYENIIVGKYTRNYSYQIIEIIKLLETVYSRIGRRNKEIWEQIKKTCSIFFTEEDFIMIEEHIDKPIVERKGILPSFIKERCIVINNECFFQDSGIIFFYHPNSENNNTFFIHEGVIVIQDCDGIVRVTPYSKGIAEYLEGRVDYKENHFLINPLTSAGEKFMNEEKQKIWEEMEDYIKRDKYYELKDDYETDTLLVYPEVGESLRDMLKEIIRIYDVREIMDEKLYNKIIENFEFEKEKWKIKYKKTYIPEMHDDKRTLLAKKYDAKTEEKMIDYERYTKIWLPSFLKLIKENIEVLQTNKKRITEQIRYLREEEVLELIKNYNISFASERYNSKIIEVLNSVKKGNIDSKRVNEDIKMINSMLFIFGLNIADIMEQEEKGLHNDYILKKIIKNLQIDSFIDKHCFEDDIVITNINKLYELINQKEKINPDYYEEMVNYLFKTIDNYLDSNFENYKMQLQLSGINLEAHLKKIDNKLRKIGLTIEDFISKEKYIEFDQLTKKHSIKTKKKNWAKKVELKTKENELLKKYLSSESMKFTGDYLLDLIKKKILVENIYLYEEEKLKEKHSIATSGLMLSLDERLLDDETSKKEPFEAFQTTVLEILDLIDEEIISIINDSLEEKIVQQGKNWEQYKNKINELLSIMGLTIEDFIRKETLYKSNETRNPQRLKVSPEVFIQMNKDLEKKEQKRKLADTLDHGVYYGLESYEDPGQGRKGRR